MLGDLVGAVVALLLVFLNGFFVLAEFALVKVRGTRLEQLIESGGKDAKAARLALDAIGRLDDYLAATQLGITLASLALGWVGEPAFEGLFDRFVGAGSVASHTLSATAAFLLISFLHVLFGEQVPKLIAIQRAERMALATAPPMTVFYGAFLVPVMLMRGAARGVLRLVGLRANEAEMTYTEEELRSILGASQERGGFSFHHLLLLENAFDFGELRIRDVMVPLDQTTCLDASKEWSENAKVIAERRLSRYPLLDRAGGKIIGLVHVKTILMDLLAGRTPDLRRDAIKIPHASKDLLLEAALRKLQKSGEHMGIAVDESGAEVGMFTLEDIVEELIGDVRDEFEPSREVSISDVVRRQAVLLDPPVVDREDLLARMVRAAVEGLDVDPAVALDAVLRRERAVPSSISGSIAVPHARVPGLREPRGALARLRDGVEFQAPDERPVRLVLLILAPDSSAPGTLARFLRRTAGLMDSDFIRSRLLDADSVDEVKEILRVGETSVSV